MDIPSDLLQLQRDFFAAEARCAELAAALPPARELINGTSTMPADELERRQAELEEARKARLAIVMEKARHEWMRAAPNWREADRQLRAAAREE